MVRLLAWLVPRIRSLISISNIVENYNMIQHGHQKLAWAQKGMEIGQWATHLVVE